MCFIKNFAIFELVLKFRQNCFGSRYIEQYPVRVEVVEVHIIMSHTLRNKKLSDVKGVLPTTWDGILKPNTAVCNYVNVIIMNNLYYLLQLAKKESAGG